MVQSLLKHDLQKHNCTVYYYLEEEFKLIFETWAPVEAKKASSIKLDPPYQCLFWKDLNEKC